MGVRAWEFFDMTLAEVAATTSAYERREESSWAQSLMIVNHIRGAVGMKDTIKIEDVLGSRRDSSADAEASDEEKLKIINAHLMLIAKSFEASGG